MGPTVNHYERLGVTNDATRAAIRAAYRERARAAHPDAIAHTDSGGARDDEEMAAINRAWFELRDPARRRAYDASIAPFGPSVSIASDAFADGQLDDHPIDAPAARTLARLITAAVLVCIAAGSLFLLIALLEGY